MMKAFDLSVGMFVRGLTNLKVQLRKGEAHASSRGIDPGALVTAKLADDMFDLAVQAHWACAGAKLAVQRLLGIASTPLTEEAKTFAELHERIDATIAYLGTIDPELVEAGLDRAIEITHRGGSKAFRGDRFLTEFAIPNFFLHLTMVYAILCHEGVPVQRSDFLGN
jgi:hypothetical protein